MHVQSSCTLSMVQCALRHCSASSSAQSSGGGIFIQSSTMSLSYCTAISCVATSFAGVSLGAPCTFAFSDASIADTTASFSTAITTARYARAGVLYATHYSRVWLSRCVGRSNTPGGVRFGVIGLTCESDLDSSQGPTRSPEMYGTQFTTSYDRTRAHNSVRRFHGPRRSYIAVGEQRGAQKHAPMRNAPLLNGPPASHGYPPQPPTKDRPTFVRTRPPRSVPGVAGRRRVMHPRATQSGTGPATGSGAAAAVTAAMTPNMMAVPVASMGGASRAHLACVVALAAQEDPPNPVPRLGPTEATGRAARSRARTLSGQPRCAKLPRHTVDGNRVALVSWALKRSTSTPPRGTRSPTPQPRDEHGGHRPTPQTHSSASYAAPDVSF